MSILVTGGCGFIASNFIKYFHTIHPEYHIVILDKLDYCSNVDATSGVAELVVGNCGNAELLQYLIKKHNFDVVFHFAAHSHVDNSFNDPIVFTRENALATHTLVETFRQLKPEVEFIHFSTDEVYGENKTDTPFTEQNSVLNPTNPYSASKAAAEMIVNSYIESYGMDIKIIRCNNVYGPGQFPEKLIPKFVHLLERDMKCTLHGTNSNNIKRAFIHVEDVCSATETVWLRGKSGEIYNISSDYELTVLEVTKMIVEIVKGTQDYEQWVTHVQDRPFNDKRYYICDRKLRSLGWKPLKDIDDLREYIQSILTLKAR